MPKMKTRRGSAKRFSLTKRGKVKKNRANKGHLLMKKRKTRKRKLRQKNLVSSADKKRVKKMIGA
ncbi:MAG: 50S ribosomal protein L35 [Candidatus Marinimicrobia bacterium]|nr:50S ribosomal protein L35 [Candidatus Neomarinimicrobiota bacterium]MBL7047149.1 50S ribosomal protein L35 [Candidatus Neomarinimicrobiota bacterium]